MNRSNIFSNMSHFFSNRSHLFYNRSHLFSNRSRIFSNRSHIFSINPHLLLNRFQLISSQYLGPISFLLPFHFFRTFRTLDLKRPPRCSHPIAVFLTFLLSIDKRLFTVVGHVYTEGDICQSSILIIRRVHVPSASTWSKLSVLTPTPPPPLNKAARVDKTYTNLRVTFFLR